MYKRLCVSTAMTVFLRLLTELKKGRLPYVSATCHIFPLEAMKMCNNKWCVNFVVTFSYRVGYKNVTSKSQLSSEQEKQHSMYIYTVYHEGIK